MTDHPPDKVQAVEPSAEEIEAAADALLALLGYDVTISRGDAEMMAEAALKAAMAVRRGKLAEVMPFEGFKEGQIVTGKGLKPSVVTIDKKGKVVLVPKED